MSVENLYNQDAKQKIKEMVEAIRFTMMATSLGQKPFNITPMTTKKVDEHGGIWFLSGQDTVHNKDIRMDKDVQLIYSNPSASQFLTIYGEVSVLKETKVIESIYTKSDDVWFKGFTDPNASVLIVRPVEAHYWDTKSNKIITLFKIGLTAVTGLKTDLGKQGDLLV